MIKTIFITIVMIFFTGCFNQDPIKILKDGTMSIDESLTIGQAFDNCFGESILLFNANDNLE